MCGAFGPWAGVGMGKRRIAFGGWVGKVKERDRLEDLSFDGSDNIKMCLKED